MHKKSLSLAKVYQLLEPGPAVMVTTADGDKANIMTMTWHMMVEFVPPLIACVVSEYNYSFTALQKTKECVINIPTVELIDKVVGVGNTTGATVDKFTKFQLTQVVATKVAVPMIAECYANIECQVVDTKMVAKYTKAWIATSAARKRTIHHCGNGVFTVDGKVLKLRSHKK